MKLIFLKVDETSSCFSAVHILVTIVMNVIKSNLIASPKAKKKNQNKETNKSSKENRSFRTAYCLEMK